MNDFLKRVERIRAALAGSCPQGCTFQLENGGSFRAECDPLSYLLQHGTETPLGRIVGIDPPEGALDPVSASLYEEIDRIIKEESK